VLRERGALASSLQGSSEVVSVRRWHCARNERRKSGRVKPDINDVHYWFAVMLPWEAWFSEAAVHRSKEAVEAELRGLPFEPYAPVRGQLHGILREVNRRRELAGYELASSSCIRGRRKVVKPFGAEDVGPQADDESADNFGKHRRLSAACDQIGRWQR
jgi:hypothetical protein